MYSVFLVEDEIVTREGIRNSIPWENTRYTLAGEAPDGEMALHALRDIKPDILITDIKMPFMDGLTLARIIKKDQPWLKIIILSGHDEFQYAKEAISIGIEEYLLKPISAAEMISTLDRVADRLTEERRRLNDLENLKKKVSTTEELMKEKWLSRLVTGQTDSVNAIETAMEYGIDLISRGYVCMITEFYPAGDDYSKYSLAREVINATLNGRSDVISFPLSQAKQILLVKTAAETPDDGLYTLAQAVKFETERKTGCPVSIGIGTRAEHISEIVYSYTSADRLIRYMNISGKRNILGTDDLNWAMTVKKLQVENGHLTGQLKSIDFGDIEDFTQSYLKLTGNSDNPDTNRNFLFLLLKDLIDSVCELTKEIGGSPAGIITELDTHEKMLEASASESIFRGQIKSMLERWINFRNSIIGKKHNIRIQEAKQYIKKNFMSQDISLNSVASFVNVSPNHFSTIFSQEVGKTFIEYLTAIRMEHACRLLLESSMKCSDIAYEAGYSDPHYFSFIFKKNMGISPKEYRSSAAVRT